MRKIRLSFACAATSLILMVSCTEIVEPVYLEDLKPDAAGQENFEIELKPLTFEAAQKLNETRYDRMVSRPGRAYSADVIPETQLISRSFPKTTKKLAYKLGIGDEVALIQYADSTPRISAAASMLDLTSDTGLSDISNGSPTSNIISTSGRIGTDGSLLLIGVGRLDAIGREISELRNEVRSILIRNGKAPNFQLEIKAFNSQKAYMTTDAGASETDTNSISSSVITITDQGITLRQLLASAGVAFDERHITMVRLQRRGANYSFSMAELFSERAPEIFLQDDDHVFIQNLSYQDGKVFLLGGVTPSIIRIKPEERQSLAEALFAEGGPLATETAQRSAVYLLRGSDPVQAYHLDAQNPLRVIVADAVELRPNDIVFVAEQPLSTFNRTLVNIAPLRILLRDIKSDNVP